MANFKDSYSRMQNIKNAKALNDIASNDLITILSRLNVLESAKTSMEADIISLETRLQNYETHEHDYEDDNGTTIDTKQTEGVNV